MTSNATLFVDEEQQIFKHPAEIWQSIFNWCFEVRYTAAQKVALKVLREVSKAFNKLTKNFQLLGTITRPIASRSIVDFCCVRSHHSLLLYALGNGAKVTEKNCAEAVEGGNLEIVKTILDRVWPINAPASDTAGEMKQFQLVVKAASGGRIEILKYLVQRFDLPPAILASTPHYVGLVHAAAESGNLEVFKYVVESLHIPLQQRDMEGSAIGGSIDILKYFLDHGCKLEDSQVCTMAATWGHKDFVSFALDHGAVLTAEVLECAVATKDLDFVKYLVSKDCPMEGFVITEAARFGSLAIVKYLHEMGCPFEAGVVSSLGGWIQGTKVYSTVAAASRGRVDCLQYMMEKGAPCPDDIMLQLDISNTGGIDVIKYLHGRGFKLTEELMNKAATNGSVQVVKFLREHNCPWSELTCASAARHGYLACVRYLLDNGCPWDDKLVDHAASSGTLAVLKYVHERGIPWTNNTCTILFQHGDYEHLVYAHTNGAPFTPETMKKGLSALTTSMPCFEYAIEHGCPWDPKVAFETALQFNHDPIVQWLLKHADLPAEYFDEKKQMELKYGFAFA